jgi:hypothetical protein
MPVYLRLLPIIDAYIDGLVPWPLNVEKHDRLLGVPGGRWR